MRVILYITLFCAAVPDFPGQLFPVAENLQTVLEKEQENLRYWDGYSERTASKHGLFSKLWRSEFITTTRLKCSTRTVCSQTPQSSQICNKKPWLVYSTGRYIWCGGWCKASAESRPSDRKGKTATQSSNATLHTWKDNPHHMGCFTAKV